jgi:hypothetical protein
MNLDWDIQKTRRLTELSTDPEKYSGSRIASIMSEEFGEVFSRDAVHNKITRLELRTLVDKPITNPMPYYDKYKDIITGELEAPEKILKIGKDDAYLENKKSRLKILHLGDLHIPFDLGELVQTAVNRNLTADIVVTSEIMDCYALSRFIKEDNVPLETEIDNTVRYFEYLSETFPIIIAIEGNHGRRISKEICKNTPTSIRFLTESNMLRVLARPFKNIIVVDKPYFQINDTVFVHAEMFSKIDLKAAVSVYSFLQEWKETLKLRPFRLILEAHTHMMGATYRAGNVKIMETGCLCGTQKYAIDKFYSKPHTCGYVTIIQNNGVSDFNLSREFVFDTVDSV